MKETVSNESDVSSPSLLLFSDNVHDINNTKMVYPASIVKLVYGLAAYYWIKKGSLLLFLEII